MVLAWCMSWSTFSTWPRVTRRKAIAILVCSILCCSLFQYRASFENWSYLHSDACSCPAYNGTTSEPLADTAVIYLQRPQRPFHGNHWFHMGEYYLSRRSTIQGKLQAHSNSDRTFKHIKIVAQNHKLTGPMTKMAFSVLVLACLQYLSQEGGDSVARVIESIELFAPKTVLLKVAASTGKRGTTRSGYKEVESIHEGANVQFASHAGPILGYYANANTAEERFVDFRTKNSHGHHAGSRKGKNKDNHDFKKQNDDPIITNSKVRRVGFLQQWQAFFFGVTSSSHNQQCDCGIYVGSVGEAPIPTTEWFSSVRAANDLRQAALSMCGAGDNSMKQQHQQQAYPPEGDSQQNYATVDAANEITQTQQRVLRLLVYQRDLNRRFLDLEAVQAELSARNLIIHAAAKEAERRNSRGGSGSINIGNSGVRWEVTVLKHSEQMDPCVLIKALNQADVFLTAHGFQSTGMLPVKVTCSQVLILRMRFIC